MENLEITIIGAAQNLNAGQMGEQKGAKICGMNGEQENVMDGEQRMTSLEIAEVTGKPHNDVMKAIRKMEPAWGKVNEGNFSRVKYKDAKGEMRPCYSLTKTECLYIATKFNDEARARLILRWKELEEAQLRQVRQPMTDLEIMCKALTIQQQTIKMQGKQIQVLAPKAQYADKVLESVDCYTTTQIAKELSMTVFDLTKLLLQHGIAYHQSGQYMLYAEYARKGYARTRTKSYRDSMGSLHTSVYLVWTEKGRRFLHNIFEK